jgi:hypothetical protein
VKDEKEPSRKVCTDKGARNYLKENFSVDFRASEMLSGVVCDWEAPITKGVQRSGFGIVCQNQNPRNKIVVGWTSADQTNLETLRKIGNYQLDIYSALNKTKPLSGQQFCANQPELMSVRSAVAAGQCEMVLPSGEKLYSAVVFIQPSNVKHRRFFVVVMDVTKPTSPDEVRKELLLLTKNLKSKIIKKVALEHILPVASVYATTGDIAGGGTCANPNGQTCSTSGVDPATCGCGPSPANGPADRPDATVCSIATPTECSYVYCSSPTAFFNTNTGKCEEGSVPPGGSQGVSLNVGAPISEAEVGIEFYADSLETPYGGSNPTISWSTTGGASNCVASGGWSGSKHASGSSQTISYSTNNTASTIPVEYKLTCTNGKSTKTSKFYRNYRPYTPPPTCSNGASNYPSCTYFPGDGGNN